MPIIYVEKTVVKKNNNVTEKSYYRDQKKVSVRKFWKFLNEARKQQGEDLFAIYEGV